MTSGYSHIIIGAGAIGSAAAFWLGRAGARVLVVEQFDLVHGFGSSGDHSRIIRHAYGSTTYTELTPAMFAAWAEIEERSGLRLYVQTGGLDLAHAGTAGHREVEAYRAALDARDLPYDDLTIDDIRAAYPQWTLADDIVGIHQEAGGLLDIRQAVSAMTSLAMSEGVEFLPRTSVTGIDARNGSVTVTTSAGSFAADHLIVAAGSWLPELMGLLHLDLPIVLSQEQVTYFAARELASFAADRFPIWLYHGEEAGDFYGFPVHGEAAVKVARDMRAKFIRSSDRVFEPDALESEFLRRFLERHLPGAVGPVLTSRTCVYDLTPDRHFILDTHPEHPNIALFVGAGHAGKFAGLVGSILADLVTAGTTAHPIDAFRLTRPALTDASFHPVYDKPIQGRA